MTVTVEMLRAASFNTMHLDASGFWQNLSACKEYPRLQVVQTGPRGHSKKPVQYSKRFYVDDIRCATLEDVAARLSVEPGTAFCGSCNKAARLTDGREIYPHRGDLADRKIWKCDGCGGYVGCHLGTTRALGSPADAELRKARGILHEQRFDMIWKTADATGGYKPEDDKARWRIRRTARTRLYAYLAHELDLSEAECHIGMFDLETCRRAWVALKGLDYPTIRAWAKKNIKEAKAA